MTSTAIRYRHVYDEFASLLEYAVVLLQLQAGESVQHNRVFYGERIFAKLVRHGLTLKRLSPSPVPTQVPETWDISSVYAIARTLVETYEALAYVALDEIEPQEREFRILLWQVHADERRLEMLRLIGSKSPDIPDIDRRLCSARARLLGHSFTSMVSAELVKKIERSETPPFHNKRSERDSASKIDHECHKAVIMHLSSHVHTHPFSVHQLFSFQAGDPKCLRLMSVPVQYSCAFLARALPGMIGIFQPRVPPMSQALHRTLTMWNDLLAKGLKSVG